MTTLERASDFCGADAAEVRSRCEIRIQPVACAGARTKPCWELRGTLTSRQIVNLRAVTGKDRSPQVPGPISIFSSFSMWLEAFDAVFRTEQKATMLMKLSELSSRK